MIAADLQGPVAHLLVANRFVQIRAERVISKDPDDKRRGAIPKGGGRPLDELGKVEQKDGLDLIFLGRRRLRREVQGGQKQQAVHDTPYPGRHPKTPDRPRYDAQ